MHKVSFHANDFSAHIVSGMGRVRKLSLRHNKFSGAAIILAVLVAAYFLRAGALSHSNRNSSANSPAVPSQNINEPEVKVSQPSASAESEVKVRSDQDSSTSQNDVDVTVNGQDVPVSKDGSIHKHMSSNGNETTVDVQVDGSKSSHSSSSSSTTIIVDNYSSGGGDKREVRSRRTVDR